MRAGRIAWAVALLAICFACQPGRSASRLEDKPSGPAGSNRGDAVCDPLLILLRAPAVRRDLRLGQAQIARLEEMLDHVGQPLWRLRDAQFANRQRFDEAWRLVDEVETRVKDLLTRQQEARLQCLSVQARGPESLVSPPVVQRLKLSAGQLQKIAETLDEARLQRRTLLRESPARLDAVEIQRQTAECRRRLASILTERQSRQWKELAGTPYDFSPLPRRLARAPEIRGIETWLHSPPLSLAGLRGKVVALHFFTYSCVNCIRNQPACNDWHRRFSGSGVLVLGIHTPETEGDRNLEGIRRALEKQEVRYPVAVDNRKETWTAWANTMWPSVYLIDKAGFVRYWWYGELNWQGARGERLFREKIEQLAGEEGPP